MNQALKRLGWGVGGLALVVLLLFGSMVRVSWQQPAVPQTVVAGQPQQAPPPAQPQPGFQPQAAATFAAGSAPSLIIPVQGVTARQLSDTWGQSRAAGAREHHAIDIMAPRGTPVIAAADGTVEKLFVSAAGGNTIYVRSPRGDVVYYYAHLDNWRVREKQIVRQGEWIGDVGFTGNAIETAPHLHFEIKIMQPGESWSQGANVNPYPLLAKVGG